MKTKTTSAHGSAGLVGMLARGLGVGAFIGGAACNAVLGIDEAELGCRVPSCPDAGIATDNDPLQADGRGLDAGAVDAANELPVPGMQGSEVLPDPMLTPSAGGSSNAIGSEEDDDDSSGSNSGGGGPPVPPSPCQGKPAGESFCDGSIRLSCGPSGTVSSSAPCATSAHCQASQGASCATCLPGEARCDGAQRLSCNAALTGFDAEQCANPTLCAPAGCAPPACAADEARCRGGGRLERCNAERTGLETLECGAPQLCNQAAARCNACVPNAARCDDDDTVAVCDSAGSTEAFFSCGPLGACVRGECRVLGLLR